MRIGAAALGILLAVVACAGPAPELASIPVVTSIAVSMPATTAPPVATTGATTTSVVVATTPAEELGPLRALEVEVVAEGIGFPVSAKPVPGRSAFVIAAKRGQLHLVVDGVVDVWLDIAHLVRNSGELGLLDVAFAPDFAVSGRFFVHYSDKRGDTTLSEFREVDGVVDAAGEVVLYTAAQPAGNHNGGALEIAPDGTLLLALGDGGGADDRYGNGQRVDTPLGAILRFDVTVPGVARAAGGAAPEGALPELWMFGLRNPWRITIDDGLLYIADVGQNRFEEINIVPWDAVGSNFGWPITEGLHCFSPSSDCPTDGLVLPSTEVAHRDEGTCSITGGIVYRGVAIPEMVGHYLFSDYCGGYLRSLDPSGEMRSWTELIGGPLGRVTGFGSDANGEVLVATADGKVVRIVPVR